MIKLSRIVFSCCLLVTVTAFSQKAQVDSLYHKFHLYRSQVLQEKLYVHVDRTTYLTGEILWFKVYYIDASFHQPLEISKVAYAEIVDQNNESVVQAKVELKDGKASGSLFLPASLSSGNYTFRAYTNWMKNSSPDFYFHQPVAIINTFVKPDAEPKSQAVTYQAQFFPEGGDLITGIKSKVGFQVTDVSGKGIEFKGALLNSQNDTIATFNPVKFGIGHFNFTPVAGEKYRALIRDAKGNKTFHVLPEIKNTGIALHLTELNDRIEIEVSSTTEDIPLVYLLAHARQVTIDARANFLKQGKASFALAKKDLREGINHITIFNNRLQPVAERLFFKKPEKKLDIDVQTVQKEYAPRSKVTLNLLANTTADLSISVFKLDSLPSPDRKNILEYLLLSSDLKGQIESPDYYFSNDSLANKAIDNLMLTHGWRRFNWSDVVQTKSLTFSYPPEFRGHIIKGKVIGPNGAPAPGVVTYVASPDKLMQLYGSRSNNAGETYYEVKNFIDERKIYAQVDTRKDSIYRVKIESPFSANFSSQWPSPFLLTPSLEKQLLSRSVALQVHDIYNRDLINRFIKPALDSTSFFGRADELYKLDDFTRFPLLEEVLREYVPGVLVRKRKDGFHFMVLDHVNKSIFRDDPIVLLDGVPIFNNDQMLAFNPLKVKKLEVLDREYYLGQLIFHGAILFSTYDGDLGGFQIDPRSFSMNYEGLQLQREFYAPRYENEQDRNNRLPDQRTLLYWNASTPVDKQVSKPVQFYTSDCAGEYKVIIQGLAKDGTAGSATYQFSVKTKTQ